MNRSEWIYMKQDIMAFAVLSCFFFFPSMACPFGGAWFTFQYKSVLHNSICK